MNISEDIDSFINAYPKFSTIKQGKEHVLDGELDVIADDGTLFDRFHIRILLTKQYPQSLPKVFEIDGRIPKEPDRHINALTDNSCCLCIPMKARLFIRGGYNIVKFYEELVLPFFANQVYYERKGKWANGEFDHGIRGVIQFYEEIFQTNDHSKIVYGLKIVQGRFKPPLDFMKCFCGRNKTYSSCHKTTISTLTYVLKDYVRDDIEIILGKKSGVI